jgi:predicted phosphohydrolase
MLTTSDIQDIKILMRGMADYIISAYRINNGEEPELICLNEAYRRYGKTIITYWIKNGELPTLKLGSGNKKIYINALRLKELAAFTAEDAMLSYTKNIEQENLQRA